MEWEKSRNVLSHETMICVIHLGENASSLTGGSDVEDKQNRVWVSIKTALGCRRLANLSENRQCSDWKFYCISKCLRIVKVVTKAETFWASSSASSSSLKFVSSPSFAREEVKMKWNDKSDSFQTGPESRRETLPFRDKNQFLCFQRARLSPSLALKVPLSRNFMFENEIFYGVSLGFKDCFGSYDAENSATPKVLKM